MAYKIAFTRKIPVTLAAMKGFHTSVNVHMPFNIAILREPIATQTALILILPSANTHLVVKN